MSIGVWETCTFAAATRAHHQRGDRDAGGQLGGVIERHGGRAIDDHHADAGTMGGAPEREAGDRQHQQRRRGEAVEKKSSGDASPTAAISDHGAEASNDRSASPALRAPRSQHRAGSDHQDRDRNRDQHDHADARASEAP